MSFPFKCIKALAWDATCSDSFTTSILCSTILNPGSASSAAEHLKRRKYSQLVADLEFVPVAVETSGVIGSAWCSHLTDIDRRISRATDDPRQMSCIFQQISVAIIRGSALAMTVSSRRYAQELVEIHWLKDGDIWNWSLSVWNTYKIACLCYHCHSSIAPSYVTDMLHRKPLHTRNTRSSSYTMPLLNRSAHIKATFGDRSFSFASSSVWYSIPNDINCAPSLSSSMSRLKTYLFRSVYKDWTVSLITVHMCMVWPCYGFVGDLS